MATVNDLEQHFGIKLSLASVCRMMDETDDKVIGSAISEITRKIYHVDGLKLSDVPFEIT